MEQLSLLLYLVCLLLVKGIFCCLWPRPLRFTTACIAFYPNNVDPFLNNQHDFWLHIHFNQAVSGKKDSRSSFILCGEGGAACWHHHIEGRAVFSSGGVWLAGCVQTLSFLQLLSFPGPVPFLNITFHILCRNFSLCKVNT